jgi:uncharacterized protein (DUF58 family)
MNRAERTGTAIPLPTGRLVALALIAAPLLALETWLPGAGILAVLYLLGLIAAAVYDATRSPAPARFRVERVNETKLSLGAENVIGIHLHDPRPSGPPVRFLVRDDPPADFRLRDLLQHGTIAPRQELTLQYHVWPPHRGDYTFRDMYLQVWTAWGLLTRRRRVPLAAAVKVYPNLLDVRRYEMLARRGRLFELGLKNARRLGTGTEFERLREYMPGDDYRQMAWAATARRGKPIVVEYETERSQPIILLLDAGRLMSAPVGDLAKLDYAINTCLLLAFVATLKGDRVGLLVFADSILGYYPPRRGRAQFLSLLEALYNVQAQPVESDYALAVEYLTRRHPRRSLDIVFTDLLDRSADTGLVPHISRLAPRHLPMLVAVGDPAVTQRATALPAATDELYERTVARLLLGERREALDALDARGVITVDVPAGDLSVAVINRYLELKARGRL